MFGDDRVGPAWPAAVLAVLAVALAGALVVLTADADRRPAGESATELLGRAVTDWDGDAGGELSRQYREVARAARAETLAFLDVDHRDMDARIDRVLAGATGDFEREYAGRREELVEAAEAHESISSGRVLAVGVERLDSDSATVLVAADSLARSDTTEGDPRTRRHRLQLELVLVDGGWKTAQVRFVR